MDSRVQVGETFGSQASVGPPAGAAVVLQLLETSVCAVMLGSVEAWFLHTSVLLGGSGILMDVHNWIDCRLLQFNNFTKLQKIKKNEKEKK